MSHLDYNALVTSLSNAMLSRRAALQVELAVGLAHFTQENEGTDTPGKSNLKSLFHGAGYECLARSDRDYKTVNRKVNAIAKLYDKLTSVVVTAWTKKHGDTCAIVEYIVTELDAYCLYSLDDVLDFVGAASNRTRKPRMPASVPAAVVTVQAQPEPEPEAEEEIVTLTIEQFQAMIVADCLDKLTNDEIMSLTEQLMQAVVAREPAQLKVA